MHFSDVINSSLELFTYKNECKDDAMINFGIIRAKQFSYKTINAKNV